MRLAGIHWPILLGVAGGVALAASGVVYWWRQHHRDPEEIERRRRTHLNQVGRIVEGQILEILETPAAPERKRSTVRFGRRERSPAGDAPESARKLVCYTYSISGVTYETAQDITGFEERVCLERLVAGQPASVKYDPSNPSNSILVADDWSGLH